MTHAAYAFDPADVATALRADGIGIALQPRLDLSTGSVTAYEALARWRHPTRGPQVASAFLQAVEEADLGEALTDRVVALAAGARARLAAEGRDVPVVVNLSGSDLMSPGSADRIGRIVMAAGGAPGDIVLECSALALSHGEAGLVAGTLLCLAAAGFRLGLDDFGLDLASPGIGIPPVDGGLLRRIPFSSVTLDRSLLVPHAHMTVPFADVASATVALCEGIGATPCALGIEDEGMRRLAASCGFRTGQGYHLGRPADLDAVAPPMPAAA